MLDLSELHEHLQRLEKAYHRAVEASAAMDGKMQSRYDTQKEDWAREAEMIRQQIIEIRKQIAYLNQLSSPSQNQRTSVGHLLRLQIENEEPQTFLLVDQVSGGFRLARIQTLSIATPIGRAILDRSVGDTISVSVHNRQVSLKLLSIHCIEREAS